jgi:hypothetical protein
MYGIISPPEKASGGKYSADSRYPLGYHRDRADRSRSLAPPVP